MRILITGHKGFIGSHLAKLVGDFDGIDLKEGCDIRGQLPDVKYTHIFHLAAKRSVPESIKNPRDFIETNCWGTQNLLQTYPGARIVNVSSASASEPLSVYGATKLFGETVAANHPNCLSIRLYNVFGEGQPFESGALIPRAIYSKLTGRPMTIYDGGIQKRDFTYVGDVVDQLKFYMFDTINTGLLHVGYSRAISVNEVISKIFGDAPMPDIDFQPKRSFEIVHNQCPYHITNPRYGRDEGLKRTIEWYTRHYSSST